MYFAARSFTEPPGFTNSALPKIVQPVSSDALRSLISGVLPTASTKSVRMSMRFSAGSASRGDSDRVFLGTDRRLMGDMESITEHELERVLTLPPGQHTLQLGLPGAEVPMLLVVRNRYVVGRGVGVD